MRRGKNYRLMIALAHLPGDWEPVESERQPEAGWVRFSTRGISSDPAESDLRLAVSSSLVAVVEEQEGKRSFLRSALTLPAYQLAEARQSVVDQALAGLSEAETHALAENMAQHGVGAVSVAEVAETGEGFQPKLYAHKWVRVSDEMFMQYGRLEDRRPVTEVP